MKDLVSRTKEKEQMISPSTDKDGASLNVAATSSSVKKSATVAATKRKRSASAGGSSVGARFPARCVGVGSPRAPHVSIRFSKVRYSNSDRHGDVAQW